MNVTDAINRRISVRAFRPDPVSGRLVRELLELACRAPSGGNLQPWHVHVLAGSPLAEFKTLMAERLDGPPEVQQYAVYPENLWEPYRTRRFKAGEDLYSAISIAREDKDGRRRHFAINFEFFGAPVGLFFFIDRRMGPPQWSDVGMYMQTLMLLAVERGLDSCAQEAWSLWPKSVCEFLEVGEPYMLFCGMALGYRDQTHSINAVRQSRAPLSEIATLHGL